MAWRTLLKSSDWSRAKLAWPTRLLDASPLGISGKLRAESLSDYCLTHEPFGVQSWISVLGGFEGSVEDECDGAALLGTGDGELHGRGAWDDDAGRAGASEQFSGGSFHAGFSCGGVPGFGAGVGVRGRRGSWSGDALHEQRRVLFTGDHRERTDFGDAFSFFVGPPILFFLGGSFVGGFDGHQPNFSQ